MDRPPAPPPEKRYWMTAFVASRQCRLLILLALAVALMPPETGLGIEMCLLKRLTNAPCPGCGMTRSGSNIVRGHFRRAFDFHPLGFILHPVLLALVCLSILPNAARAAFARKLLPWQRVLRVINTAFWTVFFIFGIARWVAVMAGWMEFPPHWLTT